MKLDKDSVLKTSYFVGALKRISMREPPNQVGTIDEVKKLISKRIEYDTDSIQELLRLDSSFKFTDEDLFSLIDLFHEMGVIGKGTHHEELIQIDCQDYDFLECIIHDNIAQGILMSTSIFSKSEPVANSIDRASE